MKGYSFYAEMQEARNSKSGSKRWLPFTRAMLAEGAARDQRCNVVALYLDSKGRPFWQPGGDCADAVCPVFDVQNSPVETASVSRKYLRQRCVRVPEALARKLHPALFDYLDRIWLNEAGQITRRETNA